MVRNIVFTVLLISAVIAVAGCGGGDGGTTPPPTNKFVITGIVKDVSTNSAVVGAIVTIGTAQTTTDSSGSFTFKLDTAPTVSTYSVNGSSATPPPGYFDFWATADGLEQNARCIVLNLPLTNPTDLGTIYLMNSDSPPPFPPACL